MSIKFIRPLTPKPAPARSMISSSMGRPAVRKVGDSRASYLQDKLKESIMERRRLAAAQAGMPDPARKNTSGADMSHSDVQDHISAYVKQKGSWIERRISRLQSEVKNASGE